MSLRSVLIRMSLALAASFAAAGVHAEFAPVTDQEAFLSLVKGKELKRPLISLTVTPDGQIAGRGASWEVTGRWSWQDGFFCRDLSWGGDDLGYNCQKVEARDDQVKFTSDRGSGDSAVFRLK